MKDKKLREKLFNEEDGIIGILNQRIKYVDYRSGKIAEIEEKVDNIERYYDENLEKIKERVRATEKVITEIILDEAKQNNDITLLKNILVETLNECISIAQDVNKLMAKKKKKTKKTKKKATKKKTKRRKR